MSCLAACCGYPPEESLKDSFDSKPFSPILSLDPPIADYAYKRLRKIHNDTKGIFERGFPPRKNLDIIVIWDLVEFKHNPPKPIKIWKAEQEEKAKKKKSQSNDNGAGDTDSPENNMAAHQGDDDKPKEVNDAGGADSLLLNTENSVAARQGDNPDKEKDDKPKEVFEVIYDNRTDEDIKEIKLFAERKITSTYTAEVSRGIEVGHNLQIGLKSPESIGIEAGYKFSNILTNEKREEKTDQVETTLNTETLLDVEKNMSAVAEVTTTYQAYKETVVIESSFLGNINVLAKEKKKQGRKQRQSYLYARTAGELLQGMIEQDGDLFKGFDISVDDDEKETVHYTSVVTLSANTGVDRHIVIKKKPLPTSSAAS